MKLERRRYQLAEVRDLPLQQITDLLVAGSSIRDQVGRGTYIYLLWEVNNRYREPLDDRPGKPQFVVEKGPPQLVFVFDNIQHAFNKYYDIYRESAVYQAQKALGLDL